MCSTSTATPFCSRKIVRELIFAIPIAYAHLFLFANIPTTYPALNSSMADSVVQ
jgi:hypothetical protein